MIIAGECTFTAAATRGPARYSLLHFRRVFGILEGMRPTWIGSLSYRSKFQSGKLGVLGVRDFRRFYVGYSASLLGAAMSSVAIAFAVLGAGGTPSGLGVVFEANIAAPIAVTLGGRASAARLPSRAA